MSHGMRFVKAWIELQKSRFYLRFLVIMSGLLSAIFWTLALIFYTWLKYWGLQSVGFVLLGLWIGLSFPVLYVQASLILDLAEYALTGRTAFYPRFSLAVAQAKRDWAPSRAQRLLGVLVKLLGDTSPLSCLSTWALVVLLRMPKSAHRIEPREAVARVPAVRHEAEIGVFDLALHRLAHRT